MRENKEFAFIPGLNSEVFPLIMINTGDFIICKPAEKKREQFINLVKDNDAIFRQEYEESKRSKPDEYGGPLVKTTV